MDYKEINYKSDFDFILDIKSLDSNNELQSLGFPNYNFVIFLYTNSLYKYKISYSKDAEGNESFVNCNNSGGSLQIIVDNHRLPKGYLKMDFYALLENPLYSDGCKTVTCNHLLPIKLVEGCSDLDIEDITFIAPYIKGEKGDKGERGEKGEKGEQGLKGDKGEKGDALTWNDVTPEQKEEVINSAVDEIRKEQITTLGDTADTNDYNDVF